MCHNYIYIPHSGVETIKTLCQLAPYFSKKNNIIIEMKNEDVAVLVQSLQILTVETKRVVIIPLTCVIISYLLSYHTVIYIPGTVYK